jgi:hypothetical protein
MQWAVPATWRGLPALLSDGSAGNVIDVLDPADLSLVGQLPAPAVRRGGRGSLACTPELGICHLTRVRDEFTLDTFAESVGWTATGTWPIPPTSTSWTIGGYVWVETASGTTTLHNLLGEPVWSPTEAISRFRPEGAPVFLVSAPHRSLVVSDNDQLVAWPLPDGPPGWKVATALRTYHLVDHPDGESFVYVSASGEIGRRRFDTGELISRTSLNERFRGTRFSRGYGLSDQVLDALELGGAVIQP